MRSATFNMISTTVTLLLLVGLGLAIAWVIVDSDQLNSDQLNTVAIATVPANTAPPTFTSVPATSEQVTPAATPGSPLAPTTVVSASSPTDAPTSYLTEAGQSTPEPGATAIPDAAEATVEQTTPTSPASTNTPASQRASSVATVPAPSMALLSNANYINDLVASTNLLWAATSGGVVAWNQQNDSVRKFTTIDGLLHNVSSTVIDCTLPGLGVIFGTSSGLQIFNEESGGWQILNSANSPMAFDDISTLACDLAGQRLVVGYAQHGVDIFSSAENAWSYVDQNSGLASNSVTGLLVGDAGDANDTGGAAPPLWIAHQEGVTLLAGESATIFEPSNSLLNAPIIALTGALPGALPGALIEGENDSVWMASDEALYQATRATADGSNATSAVAWQVYEQESAGGPLPSGAIVDIASSPSGAIWVGYEDGTLCGFDVQSAECVQRLVPDEQPERAAGPLTSIYFDAAGNLTYSTAGQGYSQRVNGEWQSFALADEPLPNNQIRSLAQDTEGSVWIATAGGVQRFTPQLLTELNSDAEGVYDTSSEQIRPFDSSTVGQDVRTLAPGSDGSIWFGADSVGQWNNGSWSIYTMLNGLAGTPTHAIQVDEAGRAWIGTGGGLTIQTPESLFSLTGNEGLPSNTILALQPVAADPNSMWIGTGGGLLLLQSNQIQVFNRQNAGLPSNVITALANDADGSLLVGTDQGLARFADGQTTQIRSVGTVAVTALATGGDGLIWVGTAEDGAYYFNGLAWQQLTTTDGLPSQHVTALLIDANGVAWIGGDNGGLLQFYDVAP